MLGTKIGEFKVFDAEGNEHTILIYSFVGVVSLYTTDGKTVLRLGKGKYQVGSFPIVNLQSTDPQAP